MIVVKLQLYIGYVHFMNMKSKCVYTQINKSIVCNGDVCFSKCTWYLYLLYNYAFTVSLANFKGLNFASYTNQTVHLMLKWFFFYTQFSLIEEY